MSDPANQAYPAHPRVASTRPDFCPHPPMQDGSVAGHRWPTPVTQSGQLLRQHLVAWPVAHHPRNKVIRQTLWAVSGQVKSLDVVYRPSFELILVRRVAVRVRG